MLGDTPIATKLWHFAMKLFLALQILLQFGLIEAVLLFKGSVLVRIKVHVIVFMVHGECDDAICALVHVMIEMFFAQPFARTVFTPQAIFTGYTIFAHSGYAKYY